MGAGRVPSHPEIHSESYVTFYQHRGFGIVHESDMPGYPVRIRVMVRDPGA
jgi:hypothetical protein